MKKIFFAFLVLMTTFHLMACNKTEPINEHTDTIGTMKLKITIGENVLFADFYDNATAKSFIEKLPLTLPMQDLYNREMVYRFEDALPANEARTSGYEVGDISYWTPRHSFVIFYRQNGEVINSLQKVGRIQAGVELFETTGNASVKFELVKED